MTGKTLNLFVKMGVYIFSFYSVGYSVIICIHDCGSFELYNLPWDS